jgi:hypothetical protein
MNSLVFDYDTCIEAEQVQLDFYLVAAARIIETVAFEASMNTSPQTVQKLLALSCDVEQAAQRLSECASN